jgi:hypothetical protein
VFEDHWCVKYGLAGLATTEIYQWERDKVATNHFAAALAPAFELAGIEYGRADHATVNDREVVYEINTNPYLAELSRQSSPFRDDMVAISRARYAAALWAIDTSGGGKVKLRVSERAARHRRQTRMTGSPFRP